MQHKVTATPSSVGLTKLGPAAKKVGNTDAPKKVDPLAALGSRSNNAPSMQVNARLSTGAAPDPSLTSKSIEELKAMEWSLDR